MKKKPTNKKPTDKQRIRKLEGRIYLVEKALLRLLDASGIHDYSGKLVEIEEAYRPNIIGFKQNSPKSN